MALADFASQAIGSALGAGLGAYLAFVGIMNALTDEKRHDLMLSEITEIRAFIKEHYPIHVESRIMSLASFAQEDSSDNVASFPERYLIWEAENEHIIRFLSAEQKSVVLSIIDCQFAGTSEYIEADEKLFKELRVVLQQKQDQLLVTGHYRPLWNGLKQW